MLITAQETAKELLTHDDILLITHANPDGDTLGSAFALYYALTDAGKRVKVRCSDPLSTRFSFLYTGYIDNDFPESYVVTVDVAAPQLLGTALADYGSRIDLCIDHHPSNELYADKTCLNPHAGATCEMVYDVLSMMGTKINKQIANCLYTGIATDTGCFKFSNTGVATHMIAAKLFEADADFGEINRELFDTKSKSRLAIERSVLNTIEYFYAGKVALIYISRQMVLDTNADESELDGITALPRSIEGVEAGITIREKSDGSYKVSLRTIKEINASEICRKFGGGGHKYAAGCVFQCDLQTAKDQLVEELAAWVG